MYSLQFLENKQIRSLTDVNENKIKTKNLMRQNLFNELSIISIF